MPRLKFLSYKKSSFIFSLLYSTREIKVSWSIYDVLEVLWMELLGASGVPSLLLFSLFLWENFFEICVCWRHVHSPTMIQSLCVSSRNLFWWLLITWLQIQKMFTQHVIKIYNKTAKASNREYQTIKQQKTDISIPKSRLQTAE